MIEQNKFDFLTPGKVLSNKRKSKKLTIEQVSQVIKIRKEYIRAIEKDNYNFFESPIYAKGFIKLYAKYLGINEDKILALYRRLTKEPLATHEISNIKNGVSVPRLVFTSQFIAILFVIVVIIGIFSYLVMQYYSSQKPPKLEMINPKSENTVTNENSILLEGYTETGTYVFVNNEKIIVDENGHFQEKFLLKEGDNLIILKASYGDNIGKSSVKELYIKYEKSTISQSSDQVNSESPKQVDHVLKLQIGEEEVWIDLVVDGDVKLKKSLPAKYYEEIIFKNEISLSTGKMHMTQVWIDGNEVEIKKDGTGLGVLNCSVISNQVSCN